MFSCKELMWKDNSAASQITKQPCVYKSVSRVITGDDEEEDFRKPDDAVLHSDKPGVNDGHFIHSTLTALLM